MIVLENCILKNVSGFYTRLQDEDKKLEAAVYSKQRLTDGDVKCITMTIEEDYFAGSGITRKSTIHDLLTAGDATRKADSDFNVLHYSRYIHSNGKTSFTLAIGGSPEYFSFLQARTEFPNAEFIVYGEWGCNTRRVNGWQNYTLTGLSKMKFVMISSQKELTSDELYMVTQAYLGEYPKLDADGAMTVDKMNANIRKLADVKWTHEEVHLPVVQSVCDGSALLEIVVSNDRNYLLAEV